MVKCSVCGTPATDNDIFCNGCGQRLPPPAGVPISAPAGTPGADQPPLPPMPGPPPIAPSGSPQRSQAASTPPRQPTQVIQPSYQQPVTPSYGQSRPQQPSVIQPAYSQAPPVYGRQPPAAQPPGGGAPPKKKGKGCLITIVVVVVLALCGALIVGGALLLPEIIDSGNTTTPPYSSGNTTGSNSGEAPLDVINNLGVDICYLYISPSTSEDWGDDWLGNTGTIAPGFTATFYVPLGETIDMQAEDCDGYVLDTQYEVYVTDEGLTYTLSP
jgi:hypothetical protein